MPWCIARQRSNMYVYVCMCVYINDYMCVCFICVNIYLQIMTSWLFLMQLMPCDCTRGPEKHQAAIGVIWIGTGMLIVMKTKQARAGWSASHTKNLFTIGSVKKLSTNWKVSSSQDLIEVLQLQWNTQTKLFSLWNVFCHRPPPKGCKWAHLVGMWISWLTSLIA